MINIAALKNQLIRCQQIMSNGSCSEKNDIEWLNNFCGDFYKYAHRLHQYFASEVGANNEQNQNVDTILLCLAQVCLCTKYLEHVIREEGAAGRKMHCTRKHFIERINWCLCHLRTATHNMADCSSDSEPTIHLMIGFPFMSLYDMVMDKLHVYSSYQEDLEPNTAEDIALAHSISKEVQSMLRIMISNALALANVALIEDKTALSALCQKALRECNTFQQECAINLQHKRSNIWDRRLKAIALETALKQLQQYVGNTICRLIFVSFVDLEKFSLDKLRAKLHQYSNGDDAELDEFIADFDVNLDRLTQIGHFCVDIAANKKLKTFMRSIIASLEALDPCIIPSIKACNRDSIHAEILEQHFCEEITKLKISIYECVGFKPINSCFYELLNICVDQMEKHFNKAKLEDMVRMGEFLLQYWQYPNNKRELSKEQYGAQIERLQKFKLMLHECRAILVCANQVQHARILKRFKILRVIMRKFLDVLNKTSPEEAKQKTCKSNLSLFFGGETHTMVAKQSQCSMDTIEPSVYSVLYRNESWVYKTRRRRISESMWGNNSKYPATPLQDKEYHGKSNLAVILKTDERQQQYRLSKDRSVSSASSVRRKESLRTVMFKRQKSVEMQKACDFYMQNSASLQISEILDQLTQISTNKSDKENC
ncbi:serendipity locus protein alpha [Eurosta solidaginis]|uniref:serendipity locus protein alpha n=1 Tax=Eurosta solidaginis TaxID=178769 RepID=UPI00353167D5